MDNSPRFNQVLDRIQRSPVLDGEVATKIDELENIARPFTLIKKIRVTTHVRQFNAYIKQYRLKEPGEAHRQFMMARVKRDYNNTRRLYDNFSPYPQLNTPRPLALFPTWLTVVFEESPGVNFRNYIERNAIGWPRKSRLRKLLDYCERCGNWLKRFQSMTPSQKRCSVFELWEYVALRLDELVAHPDARFQESNSLQVRRYFENLEARSNELDLRMSAVHADFCPGNVLVDASGITVIDFAMFSEGSIYQDCARFYHQLQLLSIKPIFRPQIVRKLQQAFLRGFDPEMDIRNPMFEAFLLRHTITHFTGLLRMPRLKMHKHCYNRLVCNHHRKSIERLTNHAMHEYSELRIS